MLYDKKDPMFSDLFFEFKVGQIVIKAKMKSYFYIIGNIDLLFKFVRVVVKLLEYVISS